MNCVDAKAKEIYEQNKLVGWWDDPNRCIFQTMQLISTEFAEATEGERKDLMDDHLPHRKMGEVELADAKIRTLDLGGRYGWRFRPEVIPMPACKDASLPIGGKHLFLNASLISLLHHLPYGSGGLSTPDEVTDYHYSTLIVSIDAVAESMGYDIDAAMGEKLAYNRQREDHKREARAKENGKKF